MPYVYAFALYSPWSRKPDPHSNCVHREFMKLAKDTQISLRMRILGRTSSCIIVYFRSATIDLLLRKCGLHDLRDSWQASICIAAGIKHAALDGDGKIST